MGRKKLLYIVRTRVRAKPGRNTVQKTWQVLPVRVAISLIVPLMLLVLFAFTATAVVSAAGKDNINSLLPAQTAGPGLARGGIEGQVILLTLDKITLRDLLCHAGPELKAILERSAVALMNVNTAGNPGTDSGYLTLGAGSRLLGNWTTGQAFNREESLSGEGTVEALYCRHTGKTKSPLGEILHLYSGALQRLNEQRPYPASVGALGEALSNAGLGVAVLGNADNGSPKRQVVTIAMDKAGNVPYGDVSAALLQERADLPFGRGCDPGAYLRVFKSLQQKASFFVVEWGDTNRLDGYLERLPAERRGALLQASLLQLDQFLKGIRPCLDKGASLLFVTPSPPNTAFAAGQRLTPVVWYNPGSAQAGFLTSATTRRPGLLTNLDIAPSVLQCLGVNTSTFFFGAPLEVVPEKNHLQKLLALAERIARIHNQRPAIIKGYILAQIILLVGGLAGLIYRFKPTVILRPGLYALLFFPLALLLAPSLPFFPAGLLYINALALLALTVLLTAGTLLFFRKLLPLFTFTGILVFVLLTIDLCLGAPLNSRSFLGYDPVGGARFYGLGNEFMGILIGAFILGFGSLFSLVSRPEGFCLLGYKIPRRPGVVLMTRLFILLSFFVLFLLASPRFGANFGGAVTAGVALAVTLGGMLALLRQEGYSLLPGGCRQDKGSGPAPFLFPQKIILLAGFGLVTAAFIYFLNTASHADAVVSHVGRTWELVRSHGWQELFNVAQRKMEMNLKLLRYSLWSRVFFLFIFLITLLYFYPVGLTRQIFRDEPGFKLALGGIIAGSLTAFFVNDSGVVAAATTMLYGALPLLLLCFQKVFAGAGK